MINTYASLSLSLSSSLSYSCVGFKNRCKGDRLASSISGRTYRVRVFHGYCNLAGSYKNDERKSPKKKVCVMVSGGGSNLKALYNASICGKLKSGEICVVVSDKPGCGGWEFAKQKGIVTFQFKKDDMKSGSYVELLNILERENVDIILLAGFLKLIPPDVCTKYEKKILNIHPALLPSFGGKGFYGERVHRAVIASGARVTGPTIHFVTSEYDRGPILAQRAVDVLPSDSPSELASRVLRMEHELYAEAAEALCDNRVQWRDDGIPFYL